MASTRPILRWAGGKQFLVQTLLAARPPRDSYQRYVEPFLGAGSLFFAEPEQQAALSDANRHLIEFYLALQRSPGELFEALTQLPRSEDGTAYYQIRESYNRGGDPFVQAARFLYLNLTGFNGIFRVNRAGEYNVPVGRPTRRNWPSAEDLLSAGRAISKAQIKQADFVSVLQAATDRDFVFLDPPYPALTSTSYFQHYTLERFSRESQCELAKLCRQMHNRGALFLMTNADTPDIRRLYEDFNIMSTLVPRFVSTKDTKAPASELIITNYEPRVEVAGQTS